MVLLALWSASHDLLRLTVTDSKKPAATLGSTIVASETDLIQSFLDCDAFAVVGASNDMRKYGAKVFSCYRQHDREVYPVNPARETVQGARSHPTLTSIPRKVEAISIITPPDATEEVVEDAHEAGARYLWMQPGAESVAAVDRARELGMEVIAGGPCILVVMGYRE